jgi:membrane protease YdiL (CAAX protease family)
MILVAASALVGRTGTLPFVSAILLTVAAVAALVLSAHRLAAPGSVLVAAGTFTMLGAITPSWPTRVAIGVLAGGLAAVAAALGRRPASNRVTIQDGVYGVAFMILLSGIFTAVVPLPAGSLSAARLSTLLVLYLITPPLEAVTVLLVLAHGPKLAAFVRDNYRWRAGPTGSWLEVARGVSVGIAIILLSSVLVQAEHAWLKLPVQPNNPFVYDPHAVAAPPFAIVALILAVVVLAPLAEEALFRGLLFGGMQARWGMWPAALLSGAVFGAAHLNVSLWLPLSVAGVLLALVYARTRSLWSSTAAHATLNGVSVMLALLVR